MQKVFCFRAKRIGFQTTNSAEMMKEFFETLTFSNTRFKSRVQCCFGARFYFLFFDERCLFIYHKTNLVRTSIFKKFSKLLQGIKSSSIFLIGIRLSRHQEAKTEIICVDENFPEGVETSTIHKKKWKKYTNTLTRDFESSS